MGTAEIAAERLEAITILDRLKLNDRRAVRAFREGNRLLFEEHVTICSNEVLEIRWVEGVGTVGTIRQLSDEEK